MERALAGTSYPPVRKEKVMKLVRFMGLATGAALALAGCTDLGDVSSGDPVDEGDPNDPGDDPGDLEPGPDAGPVSTNPRINLGAQALYEFGEATGVIVRDTSSAGTPIDLTIADPQSVVWLPGGGIEITAPTIISAQTPPLRLASACQESNQVAIEMWMQPAAVNQNGPARMLTLSVDTQNRNFTLGQNNTTVDVRVRTTDTNNNGTPATASNDPNLSGATQHLVYTRNGLNQEARVYVDGQLSNTLTLAGDFGNWNTDYQFALGNELTLDRPWRGKIFLAAVYCRPLGITDVQDLYEASY
jgi:hypothetical protein